MVLSSSLSVAFFNSSSVKISFVIFVDGVLFSALSQGAELLLSVLTGVPSIGVKQFNVMFDFQVFLDELLIESTKLIGSLMFILLSHGQSNFVDS